MISKQKYEKERTSLWASKHPLRRTKTFSNERNQYCAQEEIYKMSRATAVVSDAPNRMRCLQRTTAHRISRYENRTSSCLTAQHERKEERRRICIVSSFIQTRRCNDVAVILLRRFKAMLMIQDWLCLHTKYMKSKGTLIFDLLLTYNKSCVSIGILARCILLTCHAF